MPFIKEANTGSILNYLVRTRDDEGLGAMRNTSDLMQTSYWPNPRTAIT